MSLPSKTNVLVIQSHRDPLPCGWMQTCMRSVESWALSRGFDYRFLGEELFAPLAPDLIEKTARQRVIATDLARLAWLRRSLDAGSDCVLWFDADFLIFRPGDFHLPDTDCAVGRETWVQRDKRGRWRVYTKVHNAFLMFRRGNHLLDFYLATAERLVRLNQGRMPPQYIGPKLLGALHNIAQLPVLETAGMLSPEVTADIVAGGGPALNLFRERSPEPVHAANLCASLCVDRDGAETRMVTAIQRLLEAGI